MVRFSLSVLGDEKNKVNWAYGSKSGATIMDAAIQTFGASLASNCVLKYWTPLLGFVQDVSLLYESVTDLGIIAVLPKQSCGEQENAWNENFLTPYRCYRYQQRRSISLSRFSARLLQKRCTKKDCRGFQELRSARYRGQTEAKQSLSVPQSQLSIREL